MIRLLGRYGLLLERAEPGQAIRGSFWGDEENAVCYLQILLADEIDGFERDAEDAKAWLIEAGLITAEHLPTFALCG